jgi:hypothetical protein
MLLTKRMRGTTGVRRETVASYAGRRVTVRQQGKPVLFPAHQG